MSPSDWDTDVGGKRRDFPSTCWSQFTDPSRARRKEAADELAKSYWKPIYAYIRSKWAKSNEEAKDLTQDFFVWMSESDFLQRADPTRGRFRAFVKVALDHYLISDDRKQRAIKRGGERSPLPLDEAPAQLAGIGIPDPSAKRPEEVLDLAWRNELLARTAKRLEEEFAAEGHEVWQRIFRDYHLKGEEEVTYPALAKRHGVSEAIVINALREAKRRFRSIMIDLVSETVSSGDDLKAELKTLFGEDIP